MPPSGEADPSRVRRSRQLRASAAWVSRFYVKRWTVCIKNAPAAPHFAAMTFAPRSLSTRVIVVALLAAGTASAVHYSKTYLPEIRRAASTMALRRPLAPQRQVYAPEGVFFLTDRVVLTRSSGILAIVPGTAVRVLSENGGGTVHVTDGRV